MTLLLTHPSCSDHQAGEHHPESPERLAAIQSALSHESFDGLIRRTANQPDRLQVAAAHSNDFVDSLLDSVPDEGLVAIDADTIMCSASGDAAMYASGAVIDAVDAVFGEDPISNAFCAVRPPGHHAESQRAMGFCLFNGIAVGALHALTVDQCERVAIIDFDVHHGNGTQQIFEHNPNVLYASSHQMPLYPGTGASDECGVGNIHNAPLAAGAASEAFRTVYQQRLLPAVREFDPDVVLVSAGFDAHRLDPLAGLNVEYDDFAWLTRQLLDVAAERCGGRLVSVLEGGYHVEALARCVSGHVQELMRA